MIQKTKCVTPHAVREISKLLIILRVISDKIVKKLINNNNINNFQRQTFKSLVLRFIFVPYHSLTVEILAIRRHKTNSVARCYKELKTHTTWTNETDSVTCLYCSYSDKCYKQFCQLSSVQICTKGNIQF